MKLYELQNEWLQVQELIDAADGEMPAEVEAKIDALAAGLQEKTENICFVIRGMEAASQAAANEAKRLAALATARANNARRLKDYLLHTLQRMGVPKVETDLFKVRVQSNSRPSIIFDGDLQDAPAEFLRFSPQLDGQYAYDCWQQNGSLPPGFTVTQGVHLRIT